MYGFVTDSTNSNSSATGSFIGVNNSSSITNCYVWEINVFEAIAQNTTDVSVTKLSTLEFSQASSFGNFDFVDVWGMPSVDSQVSGAPILRNVVNAFEKGWIKNWQKNNWKTADKKPVKNMELWQEMIELLNKHEYKFVKVKGHSDNELNNRCDYLATSAIKQIENF